MSASFSKLYGLTQNRKNIMLCVSIAALLVFFVYKLCNIALIFYFGLCLLIFYIATFSFKELLLIASLLSPNVMMIKVGDGRGPAFFGYFLLLIGLKYFATRGFKYNAIFVYNILIVLVNTLLTCETGLILPLVRTIVFTGFIFSAYNELLNESIDIKGEILKFYVYGVAFAVVSGMIYRIINGIDLYQGSFAAIGADRNYFSALIAVALCITLFLINYSPKGTIHLTIMFFIMLFGGLLSASRTFFIALILIGILATIFFLNVKNLNKFFVAVVIIVILCFIFKDELNVMIQNIIDRFNEDDVEGGNGRYELWAQYLGLAFSTVPRFLFGSGFSSSYISEGIFDAAEHNTFVQSIFSVGLLGTIGLLLLYKVLFKTICTGDKKKWYYFIPLITQLLTYFMVSGLYSDDFNFSLLMAFLVIEYSVESNEKNVKKIKTEC